MKKLLSILLFTMIIFTGITNFVKAEDNSYKYLNKSIIEKLDKKIEWLKWNKTKSLILLISKVDKIIKSEKNEIKKALYSELNIYLKLKKKEIWEKVVKYQEQVDKNIDANNVNSWKKLLINLVNNGSIDNILGCSDRAMCYNMVKNQKSKDKDEVFLEITSSFNNEILKTSLSSDEYNDKLKEEACSLAEKYLTIESLELEKARDYENFIIFAKLFIEGYPTIQNIIKEYNDFVPLTAEQEQSYRDASKINTLEEALSNVVDEKEIKSIKSWYANGGAYIKYPDINDQKFSFMFNRSTSFKNWVITFPAPELNFPIMVINENRIAVNLGEWYTWIFFDLVNVDGVWKIDLIEPLRPDKTKNPRIIYFNMDEESLKENWNNIKNTIKDLK